MPNESGSPPGSIADLARLAEMFEVHRAKLLAMVERRLDRSLAARARPGRRPQRGVSWRRGGAGRT